jgi:hypothetical protein
MAEALGPAFEAVGVQLVVRNFAMGGVPSFPNSVCMGDFLGVDSDVVVWDFRMVRRHIVRRKRRWWWRWRRYVGWWGGRGYHRQEK